jgi:hypothetical protein
MTRDELATPSDAVDTRDAVEGRGKARAWTYDRVGELKPATPEPLDSRPRIAPWVKPISCYERRETTVIEGLRYG